MSMHPWKLKHPAVWSRWSTMVLEHPVNILSMLKLVKAQEKLRVENHKTTVEAAVQAAISSAEMDVSGVS